MRPDGSGRRATIGLALVAAAIGSCARVPRPCAAPPSSATPTAVRRDYCLAPPWTIDPQRPASGVEGWSAAACGEGRSGGSAYFIHDGPRELTGAELMAIQRALAAFVGKGASTGIGVCCSAEIAARTKVACLKVWTGLCGLSTLELVRSVDDALREQGLGAGHIGVDVNIGDRVGPRCAPSDPACGPLDERQPVGPGVASQPGCEAVRRPVGQFPISAPSWRVSRGACTHDGECVIDSCGSRCAPWNAERGRSTACDDSGHADKEPAYCGCIDGRCSWFRPARR